MTDLFETVDRGADFSGGGIWRYRLWRIWNTAMPVLIFVMLNPSTADENENDATVERCERRARRLGFGGVVVYNVFAFVSTDPDALKLTLDPVGPLNDSRLDAIPDLYPNRVVVCAWGKHAGKRGRDVADKLAKHSPLYCLKVNKDGSPQHPLYLRNDAPLIPFTGNEPSGFYKPVGFYACWRDFGEKGHCRMPKGHDGDCAPF